MKPTLPIDDGRGPGEEWPWRRCEDYTPAVRWRRVLLRFAAVVAVGSVLAALFSAGVVAYVVTVTVAAGVAVQAAWADRSNPWPEWRVRNLEAAEFRAYQSLARVDPDFAKQVEADAPKPRAEPPIRRSEPRTGFPPSPTVPWDGTSGPIVPYESDDADDLPF